MMEKMKNNQIIQQNHKNTKKSSKRERIIESGMLLFAEHGYHSVSMDDVAQTASVAKGTLYNYFASKEDLFISIVCSKLEELLRFIQEFCNKSTSKGVFTWRQRTCFYLRKIVKFVLKHEMKMHIEVYLLFSQVFH